jgi:hypothetical protein
MFIPLQFVPAQQRSQFILKSYFGVMLLLSKHVLFDLTKIRLAHRKIGITTLPLEISIIRSLFLQPNIRHAFQFFYPFRLCDAAPESCKQMNVILNSANSNRRAIELFGDTTQIRMKLFPHHVIAQKRPAIFRGKDEMNVNRRKRLRHSRDNA